MKNWRIIFQIKEQNKSAETDPNEMEINDFPDRESNNDDWRGQENNA